VAAARRASSRSPGFQQLALVSGVRPHPGVAVGLQLGPDRQRVGGLRLLLFQPAQLLGDAGQQLDVVPEFVGNHVGLGEVPGDAELPLQLVEEGQVQVHGLVGWAVERAGLGRLVAAAGPDRGAEQDQPGRVVSDPGVSEGLAQTCWVSVKTAETNRASCAASVGPGNDGVAVADDPLALSVSRVRWAGVVSGRAGWPGPPVT
jgi:hypothetical protein